MATSLYDGLDVVQELTSGSPTANLLIGRLDEVFQREDNGGAWTFMADALGSTLGLSDAAGTMQTQYTYEPFGGTAVSGSASPNASQYTGRENDGAGRYYYRGRYYYPHAGAFGSEDPVGFQAGVNLYAYVSGTPTRYVDPLGLTKLTVDIKDGNMTVDPEQRDRKPYKIPITSGKGKCMNDPRCSQKKDEGPLPPGSYTADIRQLSNPSPIMDILRTIRSGDWGDWRVPLTPDRGTVTYGRSGFFLHGGRWPGSAGCVDVGGGLFGDDVTNQLLKDLLADPDKRVPIIVR